MKIALTSAFMVMVFIAGHAQEYQSVVHMTDGIVIRGYIIERVADDYLKIEMKNGKVRTIYMEDVEKITKESVKESDTRQTERRATTSSRDNYSQNRSLSRDQDNYSRNRSSSRNRNNYDDDEREDYYDDEGDRHQKGDKAIGVNVAYGSEIESIAIGVKFNYGITDQIRLSPSFNYFVGKDELSEWEINADVHYLFDIAPKFSVYPLAGLTFTGWRVAWGNYSSTTTRFGANVGAGIGYQLSDIIGVGLEVKYSVVSDLDQFVPGINLTYKF